MTQPTGTNEKKVNGVDFLLDNLEKSNKRYMEAERFIMEMTNMNFFQRLFLRKKIIRFLNEQLRKYEV